jgi:hypothetical protein
MKNTKFITVSTFAFRLFFMLAIFCFTLGANAQAPQCDFNKLHLEVNSIQSVKEIISTNGGIKSSEGYKLIIIKLKINEKPSGFEYASNWFDLQVVYPLTVKSDKISFGISTMCAIKITELQGGKTLWAYADRRVNTIGGGGQTAGITMNGKAIQSDDASIIRMQSSGDIITVAFSVPISVTEFTLRVPSAVMGANGESLKMPSI